MRLAAGSRLGPYEVIAPLGAGGMGEVYRARDTRLGRDVAIKVLPQSLSEYPEVHARFEREARTISSLNHPHICTLHDVGREDGVEYLVLELIDGETLEQRLKRGPLPLPELLRLGIQIADALDRAHRAGIVHRDFKPGNVMLTRSGAKLTDFGLARLEASPERATSGVTMAHLTQSPTVATPLTAQGTLLGTFLYMAPEQLEGGEADARSDLWALGCVLYEMATGRRAFEGKSQASLISSIMGSEPAPITTTIPTMPPALDALVRACLTKDPDERIQTAHDVKLQLTWIAQSTSQAGAVTPVARRRRLRRETIAWALAGLAIAAAGWFAWRGADPDRSRPAQIRFVIPIPGQVAVADMPRISPDGRMLAFSAQDSSGRTMIWVRPLNSLVANPLPGTENCRRPFWSPDSRHLAFVADGKLKKIPVAGGPPIAVCDAPNGYDGTWSRNGDILFDGGAGDPLKRVSAAGGVAAAVLPFDSSAAHGWPAFLPDGRHFFFTRLPTAGQPEIVVGTLGSSTVKSLGISGSRVEYSPDGFLLYARERTLLAQRFDPRRLALVGEPFPIAEDLPVTGVGQADFTVSATGVLVYRASAAMGNRLVWLDREGRELGRPVTRGDMRAPALSPDGRRIAIRRTEATNLDIWVVDPARETTTRFTFDPVADGNPVWSPDGSRIAWSRELPEGTRLLVKSASGLGEEQILATVPGSGGMPLDWSSDGRYLIYGAVDPGADSDLFVLSLEGERKSRVVLDSPFRETRGRFSPNGRWIAYQSNESGRAEVYVASFQGSAGKWQVSSQGGIDPCWSRDGSELFYLSTDQSLMSVAIEPGDDFRFGTPRTLFRAQFEPGPRRNVYDVAPDGRFLFLLPIDQTTTPMTAIVNWREGIGQR